MEVNHIIPEEAFQRLVRQITADVTRSSDYVIEDLAMDTLQEAAEAILIAHFKSMDVFLFFVILILTFFKWQMWLLPRRNESRYKQ